MMYDKEEKYEKGLRDEEDATSFAAASYCCSLSLRRRRRRFRVNTARRRVFVRLARSISYPQ